MDKNTITGFLLIFGIVILWQFVMRPSEAERAEVQRLEDSLAQVQQQRIDNEVVVDAGQQPVAPAAELPDSLQNLLYQRDFGAFAPSAAGEAGTTTLENDKMRITFDNKGAKIVDVWLKDYKVLAADSLLNDVYTDLHLLNDSRNKWEYLLPVPGAGNGYVSTNDLYFRPQVSGTTVTFTADAGSGRSLQQRYSLSDGSYMIDYDLVMEGLNRVLDPAADAVVFNWSNFLNKLEKNEGYARYYTTAYFKPSDDDVDYCSCRSADTETVEEPLRWVSHSNQFFNTTLIADEAAFKSGVLETIMLEDDDRALKKIDTKLNLPTDGERFSMSLYAGPNDYELLASYGDLELEEIIPYGTSILGTVNRWIVRPIFNFLNGLIGNLGIAIIVLTLVIKLAMYPLTYKMIHSQSKMAALKPQMAKVKEKYKDEPQKVQMETMKMYREFGVNPLGGCFPVLIQMPIWIALYRFFPANIDFRQESFLWADDLSSYDVIMQLPFSIPFGFGDHISLFTVLWAVTTVAYSWYNMKNLDTTSQMNPMMKYMQFLMPIMFLFFFNSYASGLTCYLFFSALINMIMMVVTKEFIIDKQKILTELEEYRKKPKKKGGFGERLEKAMQEQKEKAEEARQTSAARRAKRKRK